MSRPRKLRTTETLFTPSAPHFSKNSVFSLKATNFNGTGMGGFRLRLGDRRASEAFGLSFSGSKESGATEAAAAAAGIFRPLGASAAEEKTPVQSYATHKLVRIRIEAFKP